MKSASSWGCFPALFSSILALQISFTCFSVSRLEGCLLRTCGADGGVLEAELLQHELWQTGCSKCFGVEQ